MISSEVRILQTKPHLEHFTECISESKRPIGMLLGAGCAKSLPGEDDGPLVPDTKGMTKKIKEDITKKSTEKNWEKIVEQAEDLTNGEVNNIEKILSQVRGLRQYAGEEGVKGLSKFELEQLEHEICEGIINLVDVDLPLQDSGYDDLAMWLNSVERQEPVEIFTTNYDLLIEQALEKREIPYFDGFVGGNKPFFDRHSVSNDELPPQWVRLWKIHGSMNWTSRKENGSIRIWRTDDIDGGSDERAVIHPSHMKYDQSRKMPYLTLIDRLKEFLNRNRSVLFVVGYSFGDDHLNDVLMQALRRSPSSAVFAFKYGNLDGGGKAKQLAKRQSNFSLFARDGGVIGTELHQWSKEESESKPENEVVGRKWSEQGDGVWSEEFVLGDFQEYGKLFRSVTGQERW